MVHACLEPFDPPEGTQMSDNFNPSTDDFAAMFESSTAASAMQEGQVIPATVIRIDNDAVLVDIGLKTEGRIPVKEFSMEDKEPEAGDIVDVYLDRIENALGDAVLSRDKARREERWIKLEKCFNAEEPVKGAISGRVKGGFTVDLGGVNAFLPGSQVDIRPVRDVGPLMGEIQPFQILKLDRARGNIVVSRRAILEESRAEQRAEIVSDMAEGDVRKGIVKNITDYGAFVDLGGIDGLLHVTDMSWKRINHPSQVVEVGQEVEIQIIKINPDTQRISLGMKQLGSDPWDGIDIRYPVGARLKGQVTNITDYGAFVELEDGVEGLIHVSEMSWTKKTMDNPWTAFLAEHPIGTEIEGEVRGITEFGLFVGLGPDLDGMVHINDIAWDKSGEQAIEAFNKGDMVKAKVLDVDVDKERISLGIKQLSGDPIEAPADGGSGVKRGTIVTCTVTEITSGGIEIEFGSPAMKSFIRRSDLSRDRADQRPERFAVGDKIDAKVMSVDRSSRRVSLSIKALEIAEEAEAVAQYGSADAGASLGDILGAALASSGTSKETSEKVTPTPPSTDGVATADASALDESGRLSGPQGDADDLKQIKGVGPAFEKKLNEAGIYHFWQIAALTDAQLATLEEEVGTSGKGAEWKAQSEDLANA